LWLHSLKVAQLLRSAASLHTNQSRSYLNHLVFWEVTVNIFRSFGDTLPSETSLAVIQLTRLNFPVKLHQQQHRRENLILRINLRTVPLLLPTLPFYQICDLRYVCLSQSFVLLFQLKLLFTAVNLMSHLSRFS